MACVSHLPHVLANVLVNQAAGLLGDGESRRLPAVGPSFRDATRVAGANSAIWTDIYISNRAALIDRIDALQAGLADVRGWLADGDAPRSQPGTSGPAPTVRSCSAPGSPAAVAASRSRAACLGAQPARSGRRIALALGTRSEHPRRRPLALRGSGPGLSNLCQRRGGARRARELIADLGFPVVQA